MPLDQSTELDANELNEIDYQLTENQLLINALQERKKQILEIRRITPEVIKSIEYLLNLVKILPLQEEKKKR